MIYSTVSDVFIISTKKMIIFNFYLLIIYNILKYVEITFEQGIVGPEQ